MSGDYIIVINAEKVTVTGNKFKDKVYYAHSGFPGGLKSTTFDKLQAEQAQGKLDLFNDLEGDIKNTFKGENRLGNSVSYASNSYNLEKVDL